MRTNISAYSLYQVFLNYPFDQDFGPLADALHFGVIAAGLLPVCARDLTTPDRPRLEIIVDAIANCRYSAHDLSRCRGEGLENFARFNMPVEMGMALFHALQNQRSEHRCAFFSSAAHTHGIVASDLAGLDPINHDDDETKLLAGTYEWLRNVVKNQLLNSQPTVTVLEKYREFKSRLRFVRTGNQNGRPSHDETQELMYRVCSECGWWDWRATKAGQIEFPELPLSLIAPVDDIAKPKGEDVKPLTLPEP